MRIRHFLIFLIIILLTFFAANPVLARTPDQVVGPVPETGGILDMLIAGILDGLTAAFRIAGMIPLGTLLYGDNMPIVEESHRRWLFLGDWKAPAMPAYRNFGYVAYALMLLTIISAGIKIGLNTWLSPSARANVAQMIFNWIVAALLLVTLPSFFDLLIQLNDALVDIAFGLAGGNSPGGVPALLSGHFQVNTGNLLLSSIVNLALTMFIVYFNVMFMLRWFVVIALFSVSPLVIWAWAKGQTTAFFLWLGECISNVLTQFVYALVFALVIGIILVPAGSTDAVPWWMYLVVMLTIIPLGTLLRKLITQWLNIIGLDEEGAASRVVGSGVGSLIAVGGAIAGARGSNQRPNYTGGGQRGASNLTLTGGSGQQQSGSTGLSSSGSGGNQKQGGSGFLSTFAGGKLAGAAGVGGNLLKTGGMMAAGMAAGTVVGLGTAPVLGSQGTALGVSTAKAVSGLKLPQRNNQKQSSNDNNNNNNSDNSNNQSSNGSNSRPYTPTYTVGDDPHLQANPRTPIGGSTIGYPPAQSSGGQSSANQMPRQTPRNNRNTPASGQTNIWDHLPPP